MSNATGAPFSLFIGTPSLRGSLCKSYVLSIVEIQRFCLLNGFGFELRVAQGISVIDAARNALANWFLFNSQATHLFFWDDDMGAIPNGIIRMFDYRDRDVVAVISPRKNYDMARVKRAILANPDISPDMLHQIAGDFSGMFHPETNECLTSSEPIPLNRIGTGLMMISRDCLMKIINAGRVRWSAEEAINGGRMYEFFKSMNVESGGLGEDYYFCDLVRAHGGRIWGCPWIEVRHVGQSEYIGNLRAISAIGLDSL